MIHFAIDRHSRLVYYDNLVGYVREQTAIVDEMFRCEELKDCLTRRGFVPRWEQGVFDRLAAGGVPTEKTMGCTKSCRIWQLRNETDVTMRFLGYTDMVKGFGEPRLEDYAPVFNGNLGTEDLEQIYNICRDAPPNGYQGHRMGLSDVVELYDASGSTFYYCDRIGFQKIPFVSQAQVQYEEPTM